MASDRVLSMVLAIVNKENILPSRSPQSYMKDNSALNHLILFKFIIRS